jgi:hypothetical protein
MVRSHAAAGAAITGNELPHAAAEAIKAAAPEATEAATAAVLRRAGRLPERKAPLWACWGLQFGGSNNTERIIWRGPSMAD